MLCINGHRISGAVNYSSSFKSRPLKQISRYREAHTLIKCCRTISAVQLGDAIALSDQTKKPHQRETTRDGAFAMRKRSLT